MLQELVHAPSGGADLARAFLRWSHFVAGVAWIGLLYFFNLVNVPTMAALDGETKNKVIPELMPRALWYFRWGAAVTVFVGMTYYAMYILTADAKTAGLSSPWPPFFHWLVLTLVFYVPIYFLYNVPALTKDGRVLAVVVAIIVLAMAALMVKLIGGMGTTKLEAGQQIFNGMGNKSLSIAVGGGLGVIMFLNVWGIIWRCQKQIIEGVKSGNPAPPSVARKAFLASRTNFWLSLPMLFFMGTSHGDWVIFGK
jgi:uncharacterized membrane protein